MEISVIVGTRNRARRLEAALSCLARQEGITPDEMEILVVDDGSADETPEVCRATASRWPSLRCARLEGGQGVSVARNRGLADSRGDFILFTDDDCRPAPDWAVRMRDGLRRSPIVAGAVGLDLPGYIPLAHHISVFHLYLPRGVERPIPFLAGANMGFRRGTLLSLGPFAPELRLAQDFEMGLRARAAGREIRFLPRAVVWHDSTRTTLGQVLRHTIDHARATIRIRNARPGMFRAAGLFRSPAGLALASPFLALVVTARAVSAAAAVRPRFVLSAPLVFVLKLAWCRGAFEGARRGTACP